MRRTLYTLLTLGMMVVGGRSPALSQEPEPLRETAATNAGTLSETPETDKPAKDFANSVGMKFKLIPAGEFMMGSVESDASDDSERPQHSVRITKPFFLGATEVTQGQWKTVMGSRPWNGKRSVKEGASYAASYVSWDDAVGFCNKLSQRDGLIECYRPTAARQSWRKLWVAKPSANGYRLPTEAEWEYACRAGTVTTFYSGSSVSDLSKYAWFKENAADVGSFHAHEVAQKKPNSLGLYDMHGNVEEWCQDWYDKDYYAKSPRNDPKGPDKGVHRNLNSPTTLSAYPDTRAFRVIRGGSWTRSWYLTPWFCRSAARSAEAPCVRISTRGFRVARSPSKK